MLKKINLIILFLFSVQLTYSQITKDEFLELVRQKNYEEAAKYIPEIANNYTKDIQMLLTFGDVYFDLEQYSEANRYYGAAYKLKDNDNIVAQKYAKSLAELKKFPEAIKVIKSIIKENPKELYNYITAAEIYIKADSLAEAEIQIDRARNIDKKNPAPLVTLGNLYFSKRVYELARQNYEEALALDPNNVEAHMNLAISYYWLATREMDKELSNELYTRSLKAWNTVAQLDSMNAKAFFEQGKIWYFSEKYAEAATALSRYVKLRPNSPLGRWYLAESLYKLGECDSAVVHLEIVRHEIDSIKTIATKYLADCYISLKEYSKAKAVFLDLDKASYQYDAIDYRKYGQAAFFTGDTTSAINYWKKSIEMDTEGNCVLMFFLGTVLNSIKNYDESTKILKLRLSTTSCSDDNDSKVYYIIGQNFIFSNQPDSAIVYLEKSIEIDPNNMFAIVYLGDASIQMKNTKKGMDYYRKVISKYDTDNSINQSAVLQAYAKLSNILLENKNYAELNKVTKRWAELFPDNVFANLYCAVSYQGLVDPDNACKYYNRVLKLDPNNKTARQNKELIGCDKKK